MNPSAIEPGELRVEAQHPQLVDARLRDALGLVAQPHQARRRRIPREELLRLRLEADHGRRQPRLAAALSQDGQDRLVPEMDAVEVADRDGPPGIRVSDRARNRVESAWPCRIGKCPAIIDASGRAGARRQGASTPK